jgi:hypothetical protein
VSAIQPTPSSGLPLWVKEDGGRLVPFEADRICQSLFAATEALGQPDPFLARELTDGVLHFLNEEQPGSVITSGALSDLVLKVVRQLRRPQIARAYLRRRREAGQAAARSAASARQDEPLLIQLSPSEAPAAAVDACLRQYSLQAVFSRDLVAAHNDGLLTLTGLEAPGELACHVLEPRPADAAPGAEGGALRLLEGLVAARAVSGAAVAIDGPEYAGGGPDEAAAYLGALRAGLAATRLRAVLNLNCADAPRWALERGAGPLFGEQPATQRAGPDAFLEGLLEQLLSGGPSAGAVRIDWHLGERDFAAPHSGSQQRLTRLARAAVEGAAVGFTFDRPRRAVALGLGMDRQHPAVLLEVGLHLPRLLDLPGVRGDAEAFLNKSAILARLALSAAIQKRNFLRRRSRETGAAALAAARGFLLDRARLLAVPVGLDAVVRAYLGKGVVGGKPALALARRIVQRLQGVLSQDGRAYLLETCLDTGWEFDLGRQAGGDETAPQDKGGLTCWDTSAPAKRQLRAAGALHAVQHAGTAALLLPADRPFSADELLELLHEAWRKTEVVRLRLVRTGPRQQPNLLGA